MSARPPRRLAGTLALCVLLAGCTARDDGRRAANEPVATPEALTDSREPELVSLRGRPLYAMVGGAGAAHELRLEQARRALEVDPDDPDALIWFGRRLGYLWRMNAAVAAYTDAIHKHPGDARFYRHRGHRYISLRRFDDAISDLERAAELIAGQPDQVEPDGMPNERNIPLTTTAFNVWYHLALAQYLRGDYDAALAAYRETMKRSQRYDDNLVATTYWTYLTLRRLGRDADAAALLEPIRAEMDIIENTAYHRLLLVYKGVIDPDEVLPADADELAVATSGYGVGCWYLLNGDTQRARATLERVVATDYWPAFGFIAAEVELVTHKGHQGHEGRDERGAGRTRRASERRQASPDQRLR